MKQPIKLFNLTDQTSYKLKINMESISGKLNKEELKAYLLNTLRFTAPTLAVFFGQLAAGVNWKISGSVALLALYGNLSDYFKKKYKGN